MTLDTLIMLSGAFVAALPFMGFPNTWDAALFFIAGVFVIGLGIVVRRRVPASPDQHTHERFADMQSTVHEHGQS